MAACLAIAVGPAVSACSGPHDPHEGGLFGGIAGLTSGEYDRRAEERKNRLSAIDQANQDLAKTEGDLTQQQEAGKQTEAQLQTRLAAIDKDLSALKTKTAALRAKDAKMKADIASLQQQTSDLQKQINALRAQQMGGGPADPAVAAEIDRLEKRKEELLKLYLALQSR